MLILLVINAGYVWQGIMHFTGFFQALLIGIAVAFILNRPCMYFDRQLIRIFPNLPALSRGLAIVLTYVTALLIMGILTIFIIPQIIASIELFIRNMGGYLANSQELINRFTNILRLNNIDLSSYTNQVLGSLQALSADITGIIYKIAGITTGVIGFIFNLFIAVIFSIYLLAGKESILRNCQRVCHTYLPSNIYTKLVYVYHVTVDVFNKFVYGQAADAVIIGGLCFIGMLILGFEYPVMISTLIGVTALIPLIGAYIGGFVAFLVLVLVAPLQAVWFMVFLVILQQIEGNLIYPRVVGGSLGLPGIWVLLATLVGSGLYGPLGILLGVPVATILYTLLKNDVKRKEI